MDADRAVVVAANRARMLAATAVPPAVPVEVATDLLRPTVCPRCDYSLAGLPPAGICPECGRAYDATVVYLYGSANGDRPGRLPSATRLVFQWALVLGGVAFYALMVRMLGWRRFMDFSGYGLGWWLPGALIAVLVATRRKASDNGSGVVRLAVGPAGVSEGVRGFGPIPYERADRAKPRPWRKVRRQQVVQVDAERVRIVFSSTDRWWQPRTDYVDATVRCSPEQAAALRSCIERWRARLMG